jgi:hypothetical protein
MTAPTSALTSGRGLRFVEPGAQFRAAFRIGIDAVPWRRQTNHLQIQAQDLKSQKGKTPAIINQGLTSSVVTGSSPANVLGSSLRPRTLLRLGTLVN